MAHERQDIRDAVIALLKGTAPDYATAAEARVFPSRMAPLRTVELPAISVYTDNETVDPASGNSAPRELKRTVELVIEAWVRATSDVEDALDDFALEIETALDADTEFNDTAYSSSLDSTEIGLKLDGDKPMGCVRLKYSVTYHTDLRVTAPGDNFDSADVHYDLAGEQATADQANDVLTAIHE